MRVLILTIIFGTVVGLLSGCKDNKSYSSRAWENTSNGEVGGNSTEDFSKSNRYKNASSAAQAAYWEGYRDALNKEDNTATKPHGDVKIFYGLGHARGWMDRLPTMQLEALQKAFDDIE